MANTIDINNSALPNQTLTLPDSPEHHTSSEQSDSVSPDQYANTTTTPNFALALTRFPLLAFLMLQGCSREEPVYRIDLDNDEFFPPEDCNDDNDQINPNSVEFCNGNDDNCDGNIDENAVDQKTWLLDADEDGFGDPTASLEACSQPEGYVSLQAGDDCNDNDATITPNTIWYLDNDSDDFGDPDETTQSCTRPAAHSAIPGDCNDDDETINPSAIEVCDFIDNNCDENIDEGLKITAYVDADNDNFGDDTIPSVEVCEIEGHSLNQRDCDDSNADINPLMTEICDAANEDENCNGTADNDDVTADPTGFGLWYEDLDADGFGDLANFVENCDQPVNTVTNTDDCLDSDDTVYLGAVDTRFDGIDATCNLTMETLEPDVSSIVYTADLDDQLGHRNKTLTSLGDVNNDGFEDLGIGIPQSNLSLTNAGAVAIFFGGAAYSASTSVYDADILISGTIVDQNAGEPIAAAGDVNADGFDDITVVSLDTRTVYLFSGSASLTDMSLDSSIATITNVKATSLTSGDFNDDGYSDIAIGDNSVSKIYVFNGPISGNLSDADADVTYSTLTQVYLAEALAAHDVNGDGRDDLISSAEGYDGVTELNIGRVCVDLGPLTSEPWCSSSHYILDGVSADDGIGSNLKILPDMNADGQDELLVVAALSGPYTSSNIFVMDGSDISLGGAQDTTSALAQFTNGYDGLGFSLSTGDLDNDGIGDFCAGSLFNDLAGIDAGKIDCINGSTITAGIHDLEIEDVTTRLLGLAPNDSLGSSLLIFDLDGNGQSDLFVGAGYADSYSGKIYVLENEF